MGKSERYQAGISLLTISRKEKDRKAPSAVRLGEPGVGEGMGLINVGLWCSHK